MDQSAINLNMDADMEILEGSESNEEIDEDALLAVNDDSDGKNIENGEIQSTNENFNLQNSGDSGVLDEKVVESKKGPLTRLFSESEMDTLNVSIKIGKYFIFKRFLDLKLKLPHLV